MLFRSCLMSLRISMLELKEKLLESCNIFELTMVVNTGVILRSTVGNKHSCTCRKKIKRRKEKETKHKKQNLDKRKVKGEKYNKIYNLYINLPPRQRRQKLDMTKRLMSSPKCRSVEVINNPARLGSNHMEVNYINYK